MKAITVNCKSFADQKPGTSGLRKRVSVFKQENYVETYVQSCFNVLQIKGKSIAIGGDGRYYNDEVLQKILKLAIANNVSKVFVAKDGLLSTPAASNFVRKNKLDYVIILSASHNPAGENGDFGIKINTSNGAPSKLSITNMIEKETSGISFFNYIEDEDFCLDTSKLHSEKYLSTEIEVFDGIIDYTNLMMEIFNFDAIKEYIHKNNIKFLFNSFYGITAPYAQDIFINQLGLSQDYLLNAQSKKDFGGLVADPNPVTAEDFVKLVRSSKDIMLGFACDADGDRNFIFSHKYFLDPADSLAIMLHYIDSIDYYKNSGLGVARSKATTPMVDLVAQNKGSKCYVVPTGWKYFSNLLDSNKVVLCGEESFGHGSVHSREKDGIWAILFYLHILATNNTTIDKLLESLWQKYGKFYSCRLDFENLSLEQVKEIEDNLQKNTNNYETINNYKLKKAYDFSYIDEFDMTKVDNQGFVIEFENDVGIMIRKSGTATENITIRAYLYQKENNGNYNIDKFEYLKDLIVVLKMIMGDGSLEPTFKV